MNDFTVNTTSARGIIHTDSSGITFDTAAKPSSVIMTEYGNLDKALSYTGELIERLAQKLEPVRNQLPTATSETNSMTDGCEMARRLHNDTERVAGYNAYLQSLINEIEL